MPIGFFFVFVQIVLTIFHPGFAYKCLYVLAIISLSVFVFIKNKMKRPLSSYQRTLLELQLLCIQINCTLACHPLDHQQNTLFLKKTNALSPPSYISHLLKTYTRSVCPDCLHNIYSLIYSRFSRLDQLSSSCLVSSSSYFSERSPTADYVPSLQSKDRNPNIEDGPFHSGASLIWNTTNSPSDSSLALNDAFIPALNTHIPTTQAPRYLLWLHAPVLMLRFTVCRCLSRFTPSSPTFRHKRNTLSAYCTTLKRKKIQHHLATGRLTYSQQKKWKNHHNGRHTLSDDFDPEKNENYFLFESDSDSGIDMFLLPGR